MSSFDGCCGMGSRYNLGVDAAACYRAMKAKDRRFDGVFFVGVSSTGIYCRPICPAKLPSEKNCTFYLSAAAAESAGYRPCLRCRPELAPGNSAADASHTLASAIYHGIAMGALDEMGLEEFARHLGISVRHVCRITQSTWGASPKQLALTRKMHNAKRLLTESSLSIQEIALSAGFGSVRRMQALFKERYGLNPTEWRRRPRSAGKPSLRLVAHYRPPYNLPQMQSFFTNRCLPGVEKALPDRFARSLRVGPYVGWIEVSWPADGKVVVDVSEGLFNGAATILQRVRRAFDLDAHPALIEESLGIPGYDAGTRVPGCFSAFETTIRVILGQQISVAAATTVAGRLAHELGESIACPIDSITHLFPRPLDLAHRDSDQIAALGMPRKRAETLIQVARFFEESRKLSLQPSEFLRQFGSMKGIGPWTIELLKLRVFQDPDAFPSSDLGVLKATNHHEAVDLQSLTEKWSPWRSYATMHLWNQL